MKTSSLVCLVVAGHVIAVILLSQGCGTLSRESAGKPPKPKMPPSQGRQKPTLPVSGQGPGRPPVQTWPKSTTSYVIKKGDSLSVIAKRYGVSVAGLMALNQISKPDKIYEGQRLKLPGKIDVTKPLPVRQKSKPADSGDAYEVVAGDSLSVIALRFGTSVSALREANGLSDDRILAGQILTIPGGAGKPSQPAVPAPLPKPDPEALLPAEPLGEPAVGVVDVVLNIPVERPDTRTYTVQDDEDLFHVSLMWDVGVDELKRINGLTGTDLEPGQVIKIPSSP